MAFDPDSYLNKKTSFDPDSYLSKKEPSGSVGILKRGWDALSVPEKMSKSGLQQLAGFVPKPEPKGNLISDVAKGTPRVLADTLAQAAPGFVSRGAILTAAAAPALRAVRPLASMARTGLLGQAEEMAMGAKGKGALEAAYKDASTIFAGKGASQPAYQAASKELPAMVKEAAGLNPFKGLVQNRDIIEKAQQIIAEGGSLEPTEALRARKAVDAVRGSKIYSEEALLELRKDLDSIAKQSSNISEADPLYRKGIQGESLRKIMPQNLRGGTSPFKMAIGTAVSEMGPYGKILAAGLSPIVWGSGATGLGLAERNIITPLLNNPKAAAAAYTILKQHFEGQK